MSIHSDNIKIVRIHKQQFDSINEKADYVILQCIEDGEVLKFERLEERKNKNSKIVVIEHIPRLEMIYKRNDFILDLKLKNYDVFNIEELPTTAFVISPENTVVKVIKIIYEIIDDYTLKVIPSENADGMMVKFFTTLCIEK